MSGPSTGFARHSQKSEEITPKDQTKELGIGENLATTLH